MGTEVIRIPATGKYRIYHTSGTSGYSHDVNDIKGGLALISPWYEVLTTAVNDPRGKCFVREFQEGDVLAFRLLINGTDPGTDTYDSTGPKARVALQDAPHNWYQYDFNYNRRSGSNYVASIGWEDDITAGGYQNFEDRYTHILHDWDPLEDEVVVGGPHGAYEWYSETPFGEPQPGWRQGKRSGVADGKWLLEYPVLEDLSDWDENIWNSQDAAFIETFDSDWALGVYFREDSRRAVTYSSSSSYQPIELWGVLFKREGNALLTISSSRLVDDVFDNYYERNSLYLNRISDTEMVLSWDAQIPWNPAQSLYFNQMGSPAVTVLRRVGEEVQVVTTHHLLQELRHLEFYWEPRWRGIHMIAPLTRTKWVALHEGPVNLIPLEELPIVTFDRTGKEYYDDRRNWDTTMFVTVCEWDGHTLVTNGESKEAGEIWYNAGICRVDESSVAVVQGWYDRIEAKEAQRMTSVNIPTLPDFASYNPWLHVRTFSVDGMSITPNGGGWSDELATKAYYCPPRVHAVNGGKQLVVAYERGAVAQDAFFRRDPDVPEKVTPMSLHDAYLRASHGWTGSMFGAGSAVLRLLDIAPDGELSDGGRLPHVLDARSVNRNTHQEVGPEHGGTGVGHLSITDSTEEDVLVVSWQIGDTTMDVVSGSGPTMQVHQAYVDPLEGLHMASVVRLDPLSPSGLASNAARHLGVEYSLNWGQDAVARPMTLRRFPGTDFYTAWATSWGEVIRDGALTRDMAEEYPDFPGDYMQRLGYYLYHSYEGHPSFSPARSGIWPNQGQATSWWADGQSHYRQFYSAWDVVRSDWDYYNVPEHRDRYGKDPWEMSAIEQMEAGAPAIPIYEQDDLWGGTVSMYDTINFFIWDIPPDPPATSGYQRHVNVSRPEET